MKKRKAERDVEKTVTKAAFVRKLRRLADDLEAGKPFRIQVAGETLTAPVSAEISIEHEREGGVEELEFQLRWKKRR
jgi:amphi-Trp domain-containing protein